MLLVEIVLFFPPDVLKFPKLSADSPRLSRTPACGVRDQSPSLARLKQTTVVYHR